MNYSQVAPTVKSMTNRAGDDGSLHLRNLYEQKQRAYKLTIQELSNENETLRLKLKQAVSRISHLHGKLRMFLSEEQINSDAIKIVAAENEKNYREVCEVQKAKAEGTVGKHQHQVRQLLEQYGCSYQESSLDGCKNQTDVIGFLVAKFNEKAEVLRKYEGQTRGKLESERQEFLMLQ